MLCQQLHFVLHLPCQSSSQTPATAPTEKMCKEQLLQREDRSTRKHQRFLSVREWNDARITSVEQPVHLDPDDATAALAAMLPDDDVDDALVDEVQPLVPAQVQTVEDMLNAMAQLQRSLSTLEAARQEALTHAADEAETPVLNLEDATRTATAEGDEDEIGVDEDDSGGAECDGPNGEREQEGPRGIMMRATVPMPALHGGSSIWEEEIGDLHCPRCGADIYFGCVERCEQPNADYEVVERYL